jgi:hypothetical protein
VSFEATVYRVLIASPGDLREERDTIEKVVHGWNAHAQADRVVLLPVRWETHAVPEYGDRPQAFLNRGIVADCDILVGAFWTRLGTPTGVSQSGTLEEIEEFHRAGKPVLLYFSTRPAHLKREDLDQYSRLLEFRERLERFALVFEFESAADLHIKLTDHLRERVRRLRAAQASQRWQLPEPPSLRDPEPEPRPAPPVPAGGQEPRPAPTPATAPVPGEPDTTGQPDEESDADSLYQEYWEEFGRALATVGSRLRRPTARPVNWIRISLSRSDMRMRASVSKKEKSLSVALVLERPGCKELYESLIAQHGDIEEELGHLLEWNERGSSYRIVLSEYGYDPADRSDWPRQHIWLINKLEHYRAVFMRRIERWATGQA